MATIQQLNEQIESFTTDIARMQKANRTGRLDSQIQAWGEVIELIKKRIITQGVADRINQVRKDECRAAQDFDAMDVMSVAYQAALQGVANEVDAMGLQIQEIISQFTGAGPSTMDRLLTRTGADI